MLHKTTLKFAFLWNKSMFTATKIFLNTYAWFTWQCFKMDV